MKKTKILALVCAATLFCVCCPANGASVEGSEAAAKEVVTVERALPSFSALESSGSIPVTYVQSDLSKIVITGSPEFIEKLITEVSVDVLHIKMKKGSYHNLNIAVTVYSPVLDGAVLAGSGNFYDVNGHTSTGNVKYKRSGSGNIKIGSLECKSFKCGLAGSGRLSADNISCGDASFASAGSGSITVKVLSAGGNVGLTLSGSGYGLLDDVDVCGHLNLSISGSGSIKVNGHADEVSASIAGSGSIMGNLKYEHLSQSIAGSGRIRF